MVSFPSRSFILHRSYSSPAAAVQTARKEGDISSIFASLSGVTPAALPERFTNIKRDLVRGHESALTASWQRLIEKLAAENEIVAQTGPAIIPSIDFLEINNPPENFFVTTKHRGVAVIRGVIPEDEARSYKTKVEAYVKLNPSTKGALLSKDLQKQYFRNIC